MTEETKARDSLAAFGRSMFERGLSFGSAGNLSMRIDGGWLMTPTNVALGRLDPARLSKLDDGGKHVGGDAPTKESLLHIAMYGARKSVGAVVHLHSTHSVAVSVLDGLDPEDALPPITAYYVMRVGKLRLLPYFPPGDPTLADAVGAVAAKHSSVLLANHGADRRRHLAGSRGQRDRRAGGDGEALSAAARPCDQVPQQRPGRGFGGEVSDS